VTTLTQLAQLELELINRARMDPLAEMQRAGLTTLNDFILPGSGTITADPKQVLAGNNQLTAAAVGHTAQMILKNNVQHEGIGDLDPASRIKNAGYLNNNVSRPENIGRAGENAFNFNAANLPTEQDIVARLAVKNHLGLFNDKPGPDVFGEAGGHRLTMLDPSYKEVGIGATAITTRPTLNGMPGIDVQFFQTQNFGNNSTKSFVTGAVYNDLNKDNFYSLGEAVSNVTVTLRNATTGAVIGSDRTGEGGGWSVGEDGGTFRVTFSGAGKGDVSATIEAGALNAKMDLVNGNEIYANANTTLNEGAVGLRLIGIQNINGTGNNLANVITGNAGANILTGGGGNDIIDGGAGTDTVVFSGQQSYYKIIVNGNTATIEDTRAGSPDGIDTITNVELVNFGGTIVSYSSLRNQTPAAAVAGSVVIGDQSIQEGNAGTKVLTFTLTRSGGTAAFDVNFATSNGTATAGEDYVATSGVVHFAAGETQKTISVTINGDTKFETDETFNVNLSNATNGATIADGLAVGKILNDDVQPVAGSIVIDDRSIQEGDAGTKVLTFTLTRSGGTAAFDVNFATSNGTATAGEDYVATSGVVRFAAGETQKTISVTINGDTKFEANETFNVNLSNATNGATIADSVGVGTIQNDDANHAPTVTGNNFKLAAGASVAASSVFSAQDLDGNSTITKYAFWDEGNGGGFLTVKGVTQASGQWIIVDAADLGTVRYVGGVNGGVETLWASAFDGNVWSANKSVSATTLHPAPSDFNGDGNTDVLWHNNNGNVAMWQMDGFTTLANVGAGAQATGWHAMDAFDFNGDGKDDILWHNDNGQVQLWLMNGAQATQKLDLGAMATTWKIGGVDDFTGDGKAEVLWHNTSTGQVQMWTMNGASHTTTNVGTIAAGWTIQDTADFNGDGKADLLLRNGSNVAMWQMDGAKVGQQSDYTMGDAFHFAGTGDFNGDGKDDILWHNDANGQLVLWQMNGANILSNTNAGFTAKGWDVAQVGDFNHDGKADLLLQNAATGAIAEWQMNGDQILAQKDLGIVSTDWHIV